MRPNRHFLAMAAALFAVLLAFFAALRINAFPFARYQLQLVNGEVRVRTIGKRDYAVLYEIDARSLRTADIGRLSRGIVLTSDEALDRFIEDYGS
ncbi:MAG: hypothetical protein VB111_00130 [Clostridiaceae bacterium]|nr:hypothetical protein [Clostridiaceae bacterium]